MVNFFEKLKKGMSIEIPDEEKLTAKEETPSKAKEIKGKKIKKGEKIELKTENTKTYQNKEEWPETEGELAIDVYQTESEIVVQSAIAGVKPEQINVILENDMLIIEGERKKPLEEKGNYLVQECYWGKFSRKILLPTEIDSEKIEASFKDGILIIRLPKFPKEKKIKILIK